MRKQYIFGNWKMNNNLPETIEFFKLAEESLANADLNQIVMGIAVPSINIFPALDLSNIIQIAAQNIHQEDSGAFTGEISVGMIKQAGLKYCVVGHSERRHMFGETDSVVNKKIRKLLDNDITPIFCLGETEEEYNGGKTASVCQSQIEKGLSGVCETGVQNTVIAYEPIWAIGTGKTATPVIAQKTIKVIREKLTEMYSEEVAQKVSILYGGSVKPENIKEIMVQPDIDGALVGGASVKAESYIKLYENK